MMIRTDFIGTLRQMADDLEKGSFFIANIGEKATLFGNKNYGQIWVHLTEECTISFDLYRATEEEKKDFE